MSHPHPSLLSQLKGCYKLLIFLGLSALFQSTALGQVCAAPGVTGATTIVGANTLVNTYYPGTAAGGTAGAASVGYTSASSRGAATAIAAGDLVMVIQMQSGVGATLPASNTSSAYNFPAAAAGTYEFARVASLGANSLNLTSNLSNTYVQNTATANNQTYQVIRVPQYSTLTINAASSIVPAPWDGTTGGVVVVDVAGAFTNNGSINASYAGFRGNAGQTLAGVAGAPASTNASFDYYRPDIYTAHGGKGEGTAGTPNRVLNVFASAGVLLTAGTSSANGTATNLTTAPNTISSTAAYLTATGRSYNGGSRAAGAPANAGGGGDDGVPVNNGENSGGGGGANAGAGGVGGNTWNTGLTIGGRGGNAVANLLANKLVLGGGGGSGTTNDNYNQDTSGGAGGGLIFIKAGTVAGTGALLANGQAGRSIPVSGAQCPLNSVNNCDGGGGGGAGGGVVVLASSGTQAQTSVRGGQGGNINGTQHGPGGGGGGGYTIVSTALTISANTLLGGVAGLTNLGAGAGVAYGAGAGGVGAASTVNNAALPTNPGGLPVNCLPALTTTKITSTPAASTSTSPPGTTSYSIVVSNPAGRGDARSVTLYDPSLPGGSATVANPPLPSFAISAVPTACTLGARTAVTDPANGTTSTFTAAAFTLPGGCTLTYTFTVNLPVTLPNGTYSNSALSWFLDPSVSTGLTVTTVLPPAAAGLTANTSFTTGGAVGGSNYDGNNLANTGDDILIQRSANIAIAKTNGVNSLVAGTTTTYTVTIANLGPADASGSVFKDPAATGLSCTSVTCAVGGGGAVCPAGVNIANLQSPPGSGVTLTTLPSASSLTFLVTCGVTATGQ